MLKRVFILLSILSLIFLIYNFVYAQGEGIELYVYCPGSVKIGTQLKITVKACNYGPSQVTLKRGWVLLGANSPNNTAISNIGIYGPYFRNFAANPWVINPGQCVQRYVTVMSSVPNNLAGTVGVVVFEFFDEKGNGIEDESCQVPIVQ